MRVFISWSGELSKNIAEIFRQWIPGVIQAVKPYYSPDDITKGTRWNSEISKELDISKIGIICLTKDNLNSPWIMFEAGALSKNIDKSKVCPLLFGIEPSDIQGPLVQFQAAKFSKKEMKRVIKMINSELGETALSADVLDSVFEMWWTKLEEKIQAELTVTREKREDLRTERDLLEEVLKLTREISINKTKLKDKDYSVPPELIEELFHTAHRLSRRTMEYGHPAVYEYTERLFMLLEDLMNFIEMPISLKRNLIHRRREMLEESRIMMERFGNEEVTIDRLEKVTK